MAADNITIEAIVEHVIFYNAANFYAVARCKTLDKGSYFTTTGQIPNARSGDCLELAGVWVKHAKYGEQFNVSSAKVIMPSTLEGMRKYLESCGIKGVGPVTARKIVETFGEEAFNVLAGAPEKLAGLKGMPRDKALQIQAEWRAHHNAGELICFLQQAGINTMWADEIINVYGTSAIERIKENPYILAYDFPYGGFMAAERLVQTLGIEPDAEVRSHAVWLYLLYQESLNGHTWIEKDPALDKLEREFGIDGATAETALVYLAEICRVVQDENAETGTTALALINLYEAELEAARHLQAMLTLPPFKRAAAALAYLEKTLEQESFLSTEQINAVKGAVSRRVSVITGGAGTGKTSTIKLLAKALMVAGCEVKLAAPTGRAAKRLSEVSGYEALTIHRLLEYTPNEMTFIRNLENPLEVDVVIIDEASMLDAELLHALLQALPLNSMLIFAGDPYQLPPVGAGNTLHDLIDSQRLPTYVLTEIFRQEEDSTIIENAYRVRHGEMPVFSTNDMRAECILFQQDNVDDIAKTLVNICQKYKNPNDLQVLTPMNKGPLGTLALNQILQDALNPKTTGTTALKAFRLGDKVMQLKNNYAKDVFNGDIGTVSKIGSGELEVDFYDQAVTYAVEELHELTLAYAVTIHKSQGSEYSAVIIIMTGRHKFMLQRNLLYTAISRGKGRVIIIGDQRAVTYAVQNDRPIQRRSRLKGFLQ